MNFRIWNKRVDEMLFSFFLKEKDYLAITLKFHESVIHLKLEEQVVASDVATDFNISAHSQELLQRKS